MPGQLLARPGPSQRRLVFTVAAMTSRPCTAPSTSRFTPDLPITELVFRLTANTAPTVAEGNGMHGHGRDRRSWRATHRPTPTTAPRRQPRGPAAHPVRAAGRGRHHGDRRPDLRRDPGPAIRSTGSALVDPAQRRIRLVRLGPAAARLGAGVRLARRADAPVHRRERHQRGDADRPDRDRARRRHRRSCPATRGRGDRRRRPQDLARDDGRRPATSACRSGPS